MSTEPATQTAPPAGESSDPPVPAELCGYTIDEPLSSTGTCYLAIGPGGRGVVLRKMPQECVIEGQLHPLIKERLSRVREIAHAGLANLHGVGREGDGAWMIWEYVEGTTFQAYAASQQRTPRELATVGRELALTLESLHMQGVVHGAISGTNVFISPFGTVRLTHVSPLLFNDPAADADAVVELLSSAVEARGGRKGKWPLAKLLDEAAEEGWPLRTLATKLAAMVESRGAAAASVYQASSFASLDDERKSHRRSILGAFVLILLGFACAFGVWFYVGQPGRQQVEQWIEPVKARLGK